jgi:hypothetical protein
MNYISATSDDDIAFQDGYMQNVRNINYDVIYVLSLADFFRAYSLANFLLVHRNLSPVGVYTPNANRQGSGC